MIVWANLNERERQVITVGVIFLIGYFFYLLIYAPLTTGIAAQKKLLREKQETLTWMQEISHHQPANKKVAQSISSSKLLTVIASQLSILSFQKYPYQLQQTSQGDIQLNFNNVPYQKLLRWLWQLRCDYAISLKELTIKPTSLSGVVKTAIIITLN